MSAEGDNVTLSIPVVQMEEKMLKHCLVIVVILLGMVCSVSATAQDASDSAGGSDQPSSESKSEQAEAESELEIPDEWGPVCVSYFRLVKRICRHPDLNGDEEAEGLCDEWMKSVEQTVASMPKTTPPEVYVRAEEGCQAGIDAAMIQAEAWGLKIEETE